MVPFGFFLFGALVFGNASLVNASEDGVRVSETFGYDPKDATRFLQAALDSDEPVIVIDRKEGDWISTPLAMRGKTGKVIRLESGVVVRAKRGEFRSPYVPLFLLEFCTNVTVRGVDPRTCGFRMWREDYADPAKYAPGEWRHAIALMSTVGVVLENISANESGGDGLYISNAGRDGSAPGGGADCVNTVVRNCIFDRNYRQGISVIGANGLLIENTVMSNTSGTDPQDGIDFEPNGPHNVLRRIVLRNCVAHDNAHEGYDILLGQFDRTSHPVDIRLVNCRSIGNRSAFSYSNGAKDVDVPGDDGMIRIEDCRFEKSRAQAMRLSRKPYSGGTLHLRDVIIDDCGIENPDAADIALTVSGHPGCPADIYRFENVTVRQGKERPILGYVKKDGRYQGIPTMIDGEIFQVVSGKKVRHVYDAAWRAANFPFDKVGRPVARVSAARVAASLARVTVVDQKPGELVTFRPLFVRGRGAYYVFHAAKPGPVRLGFVETLVGNRKRGAVRPLRIARFGENTPMPGEYALPVSPDGGIVAIGVPEPGFYSLILSTGGNGLGLFATDVPIAINATDGLKGFVGPKNTAQVAYRDQGGHFHFPIGDGDVFAVVVSGEGNESVGVSVMDPTGKEMWKETAISDAACCQIDNPVSGIWKVHVRPPLRGVYEDYSVGLNGISGWLFPSAEKFWRTRP